MHGMIYEESLFTNILSGAIRKIDPASWISKFSTKYYGFGKECTYCCQTVIKTGQNDHLDHVSAIPLLPNRLEICFTVLVLLYPLVVLAILGITLHS